MGNIDTGNTVEWAPFRLKEDLSETQLLEQANRFQEDFLQHQMGYSERQLLRHSDGSYADLIYWHSDQEAKAAAELAPTLAECQAYFAMMQAADATAGMSHFTLLKRYRA